MSRGGRREEIPIERRVESFADDLNTRLGIVSGRVALLPRSTEIQPKSLRFVPPPSDPRSWPWAARRLRAAVRRSAKCGGGPRGGGHVPWGGCAQERGKARPQDLCERGRPWVRCGDLVRPKVGQSVAGLGPSPGKDLGRACKASDQVTLGKGFGKGARPRTKSGQGPWARVQGLGPSDLGQGIWQGCKAPD